MKRALVLLGVLGAFGLVVPAAPIAQTKTDFHSASRGLVEQGYESLSTEKNWDALVEFEMAVVADPRNIAAYIGLGKTHEALGSISGGLKYYAIALDLDPSHLGAWEAKVAAHLVISQLAAAKQALIRMQAVCGDEVCDEVSRATAAIDGFAATTVANADKP